MPFTAALGLSESFRHKNQAGVFGRWRLARRGRDRSGSNRAAHSRGCISVDFASKCAWSIHPVLLRVSDNGTDTE
jgi:hypothetical protein